MCDLEWIPGELVFLVVRCSRGSDTENVPLVLLKEIL